MSKESMFDLNSGNILVGGVAERGLPWWNTPGLQNHGKQLFWDGFIPSDAILTGPFGWTALEIEPTVEVNGEHVPMGGYKAIVRNDNGKTLGVFKQGYQPHQPHQLVDTAMDLLGNGVGFTSAGVIRQGAILWLEASVDHEYHNDLAGFGFVPNLLFTTSFNGTMVTDIIRTAKYSVCDNTWEIARGAGVARIAAKHTKFSLEKLTSQGSILGLIEREAELLNDQITKDVQTEITVKQFADFLDMWNPIPEWKEGESTNALTIATNKRENIMKMWVSDERVSTWRGTVLGAKQLINTYNQHGYKEENDGARVEKNMMNVLSGKVGKADREAIKMLELALANS